MIIFMDRSHPRNVSKERKQERVLRVLRSGDKDRRLAQKFPEHKLPPVVAHHTTTPFKPHSKERILTLKQIPRMSWVLEKNLVSRHFHLHFTLLQSHYSPLNPDISGITSITTILLLLLAAQPRFGKTSAPAPTWTLITTTHIWTTFN